MERITKSMLAAAMVIFVGGTVWAVIMALRQSQSDQTVPKGKKEPAEERREAGDVGNDAEKTSFPEPLGLPAEATPSLPNSDTPRQKIVKEYVIVEEVTSFDCHDGGASSRAVGGTGSAYAEARSW